MPRKLLLENAFDTKYVQNCYFEGKCSENCHFTNAFDTNICTNVITLKANAQKMLL